MSQAKKGATVVPMVILTNPSSLDESFSSTGEEEMEHRSRPDVTFQEDPDDMNDDVFQVETQASVHQPAKTSTNRPNIIVNNFTTDLPRLPRKPSIRIKPLDGIVERDCEIEEQMESDEENHDRIKVVQDVEGEDGEQVKFRFTNNKDGFDYRSLLSQGTDYPCPVVTIVRCFGQIPILEIKCFEEEQPFTVSALIPT
eukprot:TCALIF_02069-PA protein Name:"Protein of unknown function" AED:0.63 eAED:0.63 QI:0/0.5/0/0.66/0.5/0.66/3/0/197